MAVDLNLPKRINIGLFTVRVEVAIFLQLGVRSERSHDFWGKIVEPCARCDGTTLLIHSALSMREGGGEEGVRRLREGGEKGGKMGREEGGMAEEKADLVTRLKETLLSHDKLDSTAKHDTYSIPCDEIPHIM